MGNKPDQDLSPTLTKCGTSLNMTIKQSLQVDTIVKDQEPNK